MDRISKCLEFVFLITHILFVLISPFSIFSVYEVFQIFVACNTVVRHAIECENLSLRILTSLHVFGEHKGKVYKENTENLGLFEVHKILSEYTERISAYMEKTPRDTKLCTVLS
jgi:hypothetical protein